MARVPNEPHRVHTQEHRLWVQIASSSATTHKNNKDGSDSIEAGDWRGTEMVSVKDSRPKSRKKTIIAVIAAIVIVSVSAASVALLGRAHNGDTNIVPLPTLIPGGFRLTLSSGPSTNVSWSNLGITLGVGDAEMSWTNLTTADLTSSGGPITWHFGSAQSLGPLSVWLNVTDITGDGYVGQGDYMDLTTGGLQFSANETYMLAGVYEPTGQLLWNHQL